MKVLDRYMIRELAVPLIYASVCLVAMVLIADLFDNLDSLLRNKVPVLIVVRYYLSLIPITFTQTLPWAVWFGTLVLLVNFGLHNEMLAMKAAGLKITSIVRPVLFFGFLLGIFAFIVSDRIVPATYRAATELKEIYIDQKKEPGSEKILKNVTYRTDDDRLYYIRSFSPAKKEIEGIVILWLAADAKTSRKKIIAAGGIWKGSAWELKQVTEYQIDSKGQILGEPSSFAKKVYPEMTFVPADLVTASSETSFLSYQELKKSIEKFRENGVRVNSENVDLHARLALPWQGLVMMIISIPLLARTTQRKVIAMNVLFCLALIFLYHVSGAVGTALGRAEKLFPFLAAWASNFIFAIYGLATLDKANY